MDAAQAARIQSLLEKCAAEVEALKKMQKNEYDILVSVGPLSPAERAHSKRAHILLEKLA